MTHHANSLTAFNAGERVHVAPAWRSSSPSSSAAGDGSSLGPHARPGRGPLPGRGPHAGEITGDQQHLPGEKWGVDHSGAPAVGGPGPPGRHGGLRERKR